MKSHAVWHNFSVPRFSELTKNRAYDAVVVGAGITGLTAAYLLKKAGLTVCLLERELIGTGDTGQTTAHLTYVTDSRISKLVDLFGNDAARLVWQAGAAAINTIQAIANAEQIDCEFQRVPGFFHASLTNDADECADLKADVRSAVELGFDAQFLESVPCVQKPGVRFSNQAKFHPLKYLAGLAKAVEGGGCSIHENSDVSEVVESPLGVEANGHRIDCGYLVIATHVPLMGITEMARAALFQSKLASYSSYAIGAEVSDAGLPVASFWDTSNPYYYLRVDRRPTYDYLIFGGEDHKTGQVADARERFARLEKVLKSIIPSAKMIDCWSGQVVETNDGLPYIGETAKQQFVGTGFSGNGMTFGTLTAMMACDQALGRKNPWQELFDVHRKQARGGTWKYVQENLDYPYYLLKDFLRPERLFGADGSTRTVKRGEGKVLTIDGKRVACARDADGQLYRVSAACTHLGCVVHWNNAEQTWDCPCHGSRFHRTGEVLAGPAETPLEPVAEQSAKKAKVRIKVNGQNGKRRHLRSAGRVKGRSTRGRRSSQK